MRKLILISTLLITMSANASTVTIDFESLYVSGDGTDIANSDQGTVHHEAGMRIWNVDGPGGLSTWHADVPSYTGSTAMFNNVRDGTTDLSVLGGGTFDLISIDLAPLHIGFNTEGPYPDPTEHVYVTFVTDTGHSQTFDVGSPDGTWVYEPFYEVWYTLEPPQVTTFYFDDGFKNVSSVRWVQHDPGSHQFDNIVLSIIPIPAAVWLFVSALAALAWRRSND